MSGLEADVGKKAFLASVFISISTMIQRDPFPAGGFGGGGVGGTLGPFGGRGVAVDVRADGKGVETRALEEGSRGVRGDLLDVGGDGRSGCRGRQGELRLSPPATMLSLPAICWHTIEIIIRHKNINNNKVRYRYIHTYRKLIKDYIKKHIRIMMTQAHITPLI